MKKKFIRKSLSDKFAVGKNIYKTWSTAKYYADMSGLSIFTLTPVKV